MTVDQAPTIRCLPLILISMSVTTFVLVHLGSHQQATSFVDIMKRMDHPGTYALQKYGKVIPPEDVLRALKQEDLLELLLEYLQNTQLECKEQMAIGYGDNTRYLCKDWMSNIKQPCLIYSFGFQKDFSFEEDIAKQLNCEVHSFDSSHGSGKVANVNVELHGIDLADPAHDNDGSAMTLSKIGTSLGHEGRHLTVLKIAAKPNLEWAILEDIAKPEMLSYVSFLFIELHAHCPKDICDFRESHISQVTVDMTSNNATSVPEVMILKKLYDLGFRIYNFQKQTEEQTENGVVVSANIVFKIYSVNIHVIK